MVTFAWVLAATTAAVAPADCAVDRVWIDAAPAPVAFRVELADTPSSRARGLMHRKTMATDAGMLFLYESPRGAVFWMKDTPLALDMIFADQTGTIRHIHPNARPYDEAPIPGGDGILAVLEVHAGTAARLGLAPGQRLAHPALPQNQAAWPCRR